MPSQSRRSNDDQASQGVTLAEIVVVPLAACMLAAVVNHFGFQSIWFALSRCILASMSVFVWSCIYRRFPEITKHVTLFSLVGACAISIFANYALHARDQERRHRARWNLTKSTQQIYDDSTPRPLDRHRTDMIR